jgi:hypothetical protein
MPTDSEFVQKLLQATEEDRVDWHPAAVEKRFNAAIGGKWTVEVDEHATDPSIHYLTLRDSQGQELLTIGHWVDEAIPRLYEAARRRAFKVDDALSEIMRDLDKLSK